jgi:hypothetical protein
MDDDRFSMRFERLASLGVAEVVVAFDSVDGNEILPVLDRYAKLFALHAG